MEQAHSLQSAFPLQTWPSAAQSPPARSCSFSAPNAFATSQFPHPCSHAGGAAPGHGSHVCYVQSTRTPSPTALCSHHNQCLCFCLPPALVVSDAVLWLISVCSEMFRISASHPSAHHSFLLTPSHALLSHSSHYTTASTLARFRPLPAAPTLQDSVSDSFFSPGSIFAQVGSTLAAMLVFRDTAAPICLPSRCGGWMSVRKQLQLPPHSKRCPNSPNSVTVGCSSWKQFL